jgi:ribosome biogenesis protein ERB1
MSALPPVEPSLKLKVTLLHYRPGLSGDVEMENTVGDVPVEWFRDEAHIGYDADGRKILKRSRLDQLDHLLQMVDDPSHWRKVYSEREDTDISISKPQVRVT